jgi:hypothetical protein
MLPWTDKLAFLCKKRRFTTGYPALSIREGAGENLQKMRSILLTWSG